jgi:hypothetical protein
MIINFQHKRSFWTFSTGALSPMHSLTNQIGTHKSA